jgi:HK97 family phage major capsid protein
LAALTDGRLDLSCVDWQDRLMTGRSLVTAGATVNWVGEGAPKPLTSLAFDSITLDFAKIAGIIVLNDELVRLAAPSAELLVRNGLAASVAIVNLPGQQ